MTKLSIGDVIAIAEPSGKYFPSFSF